MALMMQAPQAGITMDPLSQYGGLIGLLLGSLMGGRGQQQQQQPPLVTTPSGQVGVVNNPQAQFGDWSARDQTDTPPAAAPAAGMPNAATNGLARLAAALGGGGGLGGLGGLGGISPNANQNAQPGQGGIGAPTPPQQPQMPPAAYAPGTGYQGGQMAMGGNPLLDAIRRRVAGMSFQSPFAQQQQGPYGMGMGPFGQNGGQMG